MMRAKINLEIRKKPWGQLPEGDLVHLFLLQNETLEVALSDYGARLVRLKAPDRQGSKEDVVLGFETVTDYVTDTAYMGATVGRFANRIAKGMFHLEGENYHLEIASGMKHALHGGREGFDRKVWRAEVIPNGVHMQLVSPDGDMGFPGKLNVGVCYLLLGSALHIVFEARPEKPTVINFTNHAYFNLRGNDRDNILSHEIKIRAGAFTPIDEEAIPTGEIKSVVGTSLDLRRFTKIGERIIAEDSQIQLGDGYNHNFVLRGQGIRGVAEVYEPVSGRTLSVATSQPGLQFYTGNALNTLKGREGRPYGRHAGFCLETQHFPDSPNRPQFPSTVLRPGEQFSSTTIYRLGSR
jgi:aldose 1-epimerase